MSNLFQNAEFDFWVEQRFSAALKPGEQVGFSR
jgi:hypothetical protein